MIISHNQKRKATYRKIAKGKRLQPGLYRRGLFRTLYWVSKGERAEKVKDMSYDHLKKTIVALVMRHPEETEAIRTLNEELIKRRIKGALQ